MKVMRPLRSNCSPCPFYATRSLFSAIATGRTSNRRWHPPFFQFETLSYQLHFHAFVAYERASQPERTDILDCLSLACTGLTLHENDALYHHH